jgi:hypothetical protein
MNYFYNNFLTPVEIEEIHNTIFNINFPWHYAHENTVSLFDLNKEQKNFPNILDYYQVCHVFYSEYSKYSYIPNGIINKLNLPNKILRAKATTETYNCPHTDMDEPHLAAIYYVNDSDGFTFLFDDDNNITQRVMPKKGSLLLFDGTKKHASGHPIESLKRCVINFNLSK